MRSVDDILRRAREHRALFREFWDEGRHLSGEDQARLARGLAGIKPVMITDSGGHRRRADEAFRLKRADKQRIATALIGEDARNEDIAELAQMSVRAVQNLRGRLSAAESPESGPTDGSNKPSRGAGSGGPATTMPGGQNPPREALRLAYLDATSGANLEAERAFFKVVGPGPTGVPTYPEDYERPDWHSWVYGAARNPILG